MSDGIVLLVEKASERSHADRCIECGLTLRPCRGVVVSVYALGEWIGALGICCLRDWAKPSYVEEVRPR